MEEEDLFGAFNAKAGQEKRAEIQAPAAWQVSALVAEALAGGGARTRELQQRPSGLREHKIPQHAFAQLLCDAAARRVVRTPLFCQQGAVEPIVFDGGFYIDTAPANFEVSSVRDSSEVHDWPQIIFEPVARAGHAVDDRPDSSADGGACPPSAQEAKTKKGPASSSCFNCGWSAALPLCPQDRPRVA